MSTTVTYTCDRCKKDVALDKDYYQSSPLWRVAIICEPVRNISSYRMSDRYQEVEWCRPCVDEMKVMTPLIRAEGPEQPPSLETVIRQIVRSEMESEE